MLSPGQPEVGRCFRAQTLVLPIDVEGSLQEFDRFRDRAQRDVEESEVDPGVRLLRHHVLVVKTLYRLQKFTPGFPILPQLEVSQAELI